MTSDTYNAKQVYFEAFTHLSLLENALKHITEEDVANFQISILGKVSEFYLDKDTEISKDMNALKIYWEKVLGNTIHFGVFHNPEIGNIFIVGTLASSFLYKIDGKTLGMLSAGPYGILRGIGGSDAQVATHLKMLNDGNYLLIFRGTGADLENYKRLLEEK